MRSLALLISSLVLALGFCLGARGGDPIRKDALGDPLPDGALARLGTARFRTDPYTRTVCLSPDGKRLAFSGYAYGTYVIDATDGRPLGRISEDGADTLAFSPAGDVLLTMSSGDGVGVWDVNTRKALRHFAPKDARSETFVVSGDGQVMAFLPARFSPKSTIPVWDVSGKEIATLETIHSRNLGAALTGDGKRMVSWGQAARDDRSVNRGALFSTVQVWDVTAGKELQRVQTDGGAGVLSAALSPDGQTLAVETSGGGVQFWGATTGKLQFRLQGPPTFPNGASLAYTPDGKRVFVSTDNGALQGWEVESGRRLSLAEGPAGRLCGLAFPPGGKALGCTRDGQRLVVWELETGKTIGTEAGHDAAVAALVYAPDGKTLTSVGADGVIIRWDAATGKELSRPGDPLPREEPERRSRWRQTFRISADGKYVFSYGGGNGPDRAEIRDAQTGQDLFSTGRAGDSGWCISPPAAFSPDGSLLAVADGGARADDPPHIHVWEIATGQEKYALKGCKGPACALAFTPGGKALAAVIHPGSLPVVGETPPEVFVWQVGDGKEPRSLKKCDEPARGGFDCLAYSPDGLVLAATGGDGSLAAWDAETGKERWRFGPTGEYTVAPPAFSADGRRVAVATHVRESEEVRVRVFEVAGGKMLRQFAGTFGAVRSLAFSPDGEVLASGGEDTTILLWRVKSED